MWLGAGEPLQEMFVESYIQKRIGDLRGRNLMEGNRLLKQLKPLQTTLRYRRGDTEQTREVCTFSETSFSIAADLEYEQTGVIIGTVGKKGDERFLHVID